MVILYQKVTHSALPRNTQLETAVTPKLSSETQMCEINSNYQLCRQGTHPAYSVAGISKIYMGIKLMWCSNKCEYHHRLQTVFILGKMRKQKGL